MFVNCKSQMSHMTSAKAVRLMTKLLQLQLQAVFSQLQLQAANIYPGAVYCRSMGQESLMVLYLPCNPIEYFQCLKAEMSMPDAWKMQCCHATVVTSMARSQNSRCNEGSYVAVTGRQLCCWNNSYYSYTTYASICSHNFW